jgi:hypothetical protein
VRRFVGGGDKYHLAQQCALARLPAPEFEVLFHPTRKWKIDVAWPAVKFGIEIDGGVFLQHADGRVGGRHNFGAGYRNDIEKFFEAAILGWRLVRVLPEHITSGQALSWAEHILREGS